MSHEPVGPLKIGQLVVLINIKDDRYNLVGRIGTVVRGPTIDFRARSYTGESIIETGVTYGVEVPGTANLGRAKSGRWCCRRHQLLPLEDPGDTEETFRPQTRLANLRLKVRK